MLYLWTCAVPLWSQGDNAASVTQCEITCPGTEQCQFSIFDLWICENLCSIFEKVDQLAGADPEGTAGARGLRSEGDSRRQRRRGQDAKSVDAGDAECAEPRCQRRRGWWKLEGVPPPQTTKGSGGASWALPLGSKAEPLPENGFQYFPSVRERLSLRCLS